MLRNEVKDIPTLNIKHTDMDFKASIHNRFDIEVRDAKTGKLKQRAQAFNVICENLWVKFDRGGWFSYIAYGNGTGTPSSADTNLFGTAKYAALSNVETVVDKKNGVAWRTRKVTLDETVSQFFTIREVGLTSSNGEGNLCTHAMLQDMNGNQISIYKTSTDIITLYATVFVHWDPSGYDKVTISSQLAAADGPDTFLAAAVGYGFSMGYFVQYSGTYYRGIPSVGLGTAVTAGASSEAPTVTWNKSTRTFTIKLPRIAVGSGNVDGGFGWLKISNTYPSTPYEFAIIDVRGNYEVVGEAVGTGNGSKTEFKTLFDLPRNATIFVDGVVASNVSVREIPRTTNAYNYFVQVEDFLYNGKMACRCNADNFRGCFYNPLWEIGLRSFSGNSSIKLSFSDDMITWSEPMTSGNIPEEYQHCKYINITCTSTSSSITAPTIYFTTGMYGNNIIFDEPPANGSVITANYTTPFVPKDSNHVYDLTFTVQFGEYAQGV